jgi:flagellar L-ring protein precursor FlgH
MKKLAWLFLLASAACSTVPPTNIHQPMSVRPAPRYEAVNANGAIYQAVSARPLFEDRRARYVGDTITVKMNEHVDYNGKTYPIAALPENLMDIIQAGGLVKAMRKRNGLD